MSLFWVLKVILVYIDEADIAAYNNLHGYLN